MPPLQRKKKPAVVAVVKAPSQKAAIIETKMVPIRQMQVYHRNPRIGDIGMIAASLEANGQFRPVLMNLGTKTGRKNEVLAGNHTFLAARHLGWTHILASIINVDDDRARRIVLADNKTAEAGGYDPAELDKLLAEVPDFDDGSTGFSPAEKEALDKRMQQVDKETELLISEIETAAPPEERKKQREERLNRITERRAKMTEDEKVAEDKEADDLDEAVYMESDRLKSAPDELPGVDSLKERGAVSFPGVGEWGIPELMDDMLIQWDEVPDNLTTWAGSATREMDQSDITWLYNWGIDSTSGMKDLSKMFVSFYCYDRYFDDWWNFSDRYTAKLINMGVQGLLTPDWTMADNRTESLMALFKSRWVGRYVQEAGIPVIPHIQWPDSDREFLEKFVLPTLPVGTPVIAMQLQTLDPELTSGGVTGYMDTVRMIFDTVEPDGAILYVGTQVKKMIDDGTFEIPVPAKILMARQFYLGQRAKVRKKNLGT